MAKVWKLLALLLVITALVWLTTMWRWQSAQADPGVTDLVLTLGVLPVAMSLTLAGLIWAIGRLRLYASVPATAVPAASAATPSQAAPVRTGENERSAYVTVLSSAVQLRSGSEWRNAQASIATGECKPGLDKHLKDDDGIAVFTAPMPELSTVATMDKLDTLLAPLSQRDAAAWAGYDTPVEVLRALTLMERVALAMQEALEVQWPALSAALPGSRKPGSPGVLPIVSIRVAIPARWSTPSQQLAIAWLEQLFDPFIETGLKAAGQSRALAHTTHPAVQLQVHAVANAEAFWLLMDQQLTQWQRDKQAGLLWALAADSLVGENDTAAMASAHELFSGSNPRGRVPGEGAAALLLSSSAWPTPADAEPPLARLHRANLLRRDKSADASGRVSAQTLLQGATGALQASGWPAAQVQHLTSDTDHRASRTGEVYEALLELLPHLDASERALRLGLGCGDLGVARLLACVALSASQVKASQQPALVLGAFPAFERFAVVVTPSVAPPGAPAAVSAQAA